MKLKDVKNEKIKNYLSNFKNLNFEDISILINEPIMVLLEDYERHVNLRIAECFGDLIIYVNDKFFGSFTQRECRNNDGTREMYWVCN